MTLDQIEEFEQFSFEQFVAFATSCGGLDVMKGVMRGTHKATVELVRRLTTPIAFTAAGGTINLAKFWQTRQGLWLSDNFKSMILAVAKLSPVTVDSMTRSYRDLAEDANEEEIDREAPEGGVFENLEDFLTHLALELTAQWGGIDGRLLNNEYKANLYRVRVGQAVLTVHANWHSAYRGWCVSALQPMADRCRAGYRVFYATAPRT
jgi:hypothetical protein